MIQVIKKYLLGRSDHDIGWEGKTPSSWPGNIGGIHVMSNLGLLGVPATDRHATVFTAE